jgi:hypothetical protein
MRKYKDKAVEKQSKTKQKISRKLKVLPEK